VRVCLRDWRPGSALGRPLFIETDAAVAGVKTTDPGAAEPRMRLLAQVVPRKAGSVRLYQRVAVDLRTLVQRSPSPH
jgi:hypothetical protein